MATQSELAQIQHILGKRRNLDQNPLDLSARKKSREYLDSHKDVEKRRRDRINTCLDIIRTLVPLCHQLPRHRRVDKADLLDLAIIYLRMVNQFLEKLGINDIFSAAHQQVALFTSLEKWVRNQGEKSQDVPSFTKDILSYLEGEVETASHVIASQQSAGNSTPGSENGFQQNSDWMKHEQSGLNDDLSGPRSCQTSSGTDEERSQGGYRDRESGSSGSEDSMGIGSPSNYVSGMDFPRRCSQSSIMEGSDGPFPFSGKNHGGCERSSNGNGYSSPVCQNIPRVKCVDKAVNTDASLTNFTWPQDSTFTLPILSGKIVLHTPMGMNGTNNLNAPVTFHAEIQSSPFQTQPPTNDDNEIYPRQASDGKISPKRVSEANASAGEPMCSPPRSTGSKRSDNIPFNHKTSFNNGLPGRPLICPKRRTSHDIAVPVPMIHPDRYCLQPERQNNPMNPEESYCYDEAELKSYTSLVPLRGSIEERGTRYPAPLSQQSQVANSGPDGSDSKYRDEQNGSFFKRYVDVLGQSQERNDNGNSVRNKSCNCCTNTSSSLKLKSLMVHRHQTQHVTSR